MTGSDRVVEAGSDATPLRGLPALPGLRAAALAVRDHDRVVLLDCAGYDCDTMQRGAVLPLDAGLPLTECVRTGQRVVQGAGPSWVALPFTRGRAAGALLLSLTGTPPDAATLERLGALTPGLAAGVPGWEVATRCLPYDGPLGGDVLLSLPDGRGGDWLLAADVCGYGPAAAAVAARVTDVLTGHAPLAAGPVELLAAADRELRDAIDDAAFVTAVAVHADGRRLTAASAGHSAPLLLSPAGPRVLAVQPGTPLGLDVDVPTRPTAAVAELPQGGVLLLHTDGLVDRRGVDGSLTLDLLPLVTGLPLDDLSVLADTLLTGAAVCGAAGDDVSLLVARPLG